MLDILILSYLDGVTRSNEELGVNSKVTQGKPDGNSKVDRDMMFESIYRVIEGKTFADRIRDYARAGDVEGIMRVAETEAHYNDSTGAKNAAVKEGATKKTWRTMLDDRVRDPHRDLEGVTVGIDELFYIDGIGADRPGAFGVPELDVNCRCQLKYKK